MFSRLKVSLNGDSAEIYMYYFVKAKNYKPLKVQDFLYL